MTLFAGSIRAGLMFAVAACAGGSTPKTAPPSQSMTQIWTVNADGGVCQSYAHCGALQPGARCERLGDSTTVVQLEDVPCLAGRPDVRQWDIGQLASDGSCVILGAKCGTELTPCTPPAQRVSCPPAPSTTAAPSGDTEAMGTPDFAVTARGNLDRGRAALTAKDAKLARGYFEYVRERFPFSALAHDAELGLVDADALAFRLGAGGAVAPIDSHCAFIAHHPWHPRVVSGDVACQLERLQNRACVPGDRAAERSCAPVASPAADAELTKARAALAKNDRAAAVTHFELVMKHAPRARSSHEAELALIDLGLVDVTVTGEDATAPLCTFIEHHPFEAAVTSGDVGCRINKLQGETCVAKQIVPTKYCKLTYCDDPNGEGRGRPECKR